MPFNSSVYISRHPVRLADKNCDISRPVRFTKTIEPGDKTAVRFTWVCNNDVINKNTAVRLTWFQNSFETFETTSGDSF